jgi:hypothetical protein
VPMKHRRFCYVAVLTAALTASCSSPEGGSSTNPLAPPSGASTNLEPELTSSVTETNRYRATVGLPHSPVQARWKPMRRLEPTPDWDA